MRSMLGRLMYLLLVLTLMSGVAVSCGPSAKFEISLLTISPPKIGTGQSVTVEASVTNAGQAEGKYTAVLKINDKTVESKEITVGAGDKKTITFQYSANALGQYKVELNGLVGTLEVVKPAEFQVTSITISPAEIVAGKPVTVGAEIKNSGEVEGTYSAKLTVDGKVVETKGVSVAAGNAQKASFTTPLGAGPHNIELGGLSKAVTALKPAEFAVANLSIEPSEVPVGTSVTVTARISNIGEIAGTFTAVLAIDGKNTESKDISLNPAVTEAVTFTLSKNTAGSYEITLGSQKGTLTVFETKRQLLRRDNGQNSYGWGMYDPRGQWVKFSPPSTPFVIQKILVMGKRLDFSGVEQKSYTIKIWDKDFSKQLYSADYPYTKFSAGFTMVAHEVKPEVRVDGDFYVDFISHSESPPAGQKPSVAIYVATDYSTASREYAGYSWLGTIDTKYMSEAVQREPKLSAFSWIIQTDGLARASSPIPAPAGETQITGATLADSVLRKDVLNTIMLFEAIYAPGTKPTVVNTEVTQAMTADGKWRERWAFDRKGVTVAYDVQFTPDPKGGTFINVSLIKTP